MRQDFSMVANGVEEMLDVVLSLYEQPWRLQDRFAGAVDQAQKLGNLKQNVTNLIINLMQRVDASHVDNKGSQFISSFDREISEIASRYTQSESRERQDSFSLMGKLFLHAGEYVAHEVYELNLADRSKVFVVYRGQFNSHPQYRPELVLGK
ncbi:MAG: hypothetical protein KDJ50_08795 [Alphaproteobacteria bacterium]|nr:hypothetical protein [Alphaproteobacteria bacterium]